MEIIEYYLQRKASEEVPKIIRAQIERWINSMLEYLERKLSHTQAVFSRFSVTIAINIRFRPYCQHQ